MILKIKREDSKTSDLCPAFDNEIHHLQDEIDHFNTIINWNGMWDLNGVRDRLSQGWEFVVFKPDDTIKGWCWLDTIKKEVCNCYVNPLYRNKGIGVELINSTHRYCQDCERWWCHSEDWNEPAHKMLLNCGYERII